MTKRLYRSDDRVIGGVCSGIAEYLDFDPVAVRLGYAFLTLKNLLLGSAVLYRGVDRDA